MAQDAATPSRMDDLLRQQLVEQRIVVLGQMVDDETANRICAQLLLLSAEDSRSDISLYINSPGGSVSAGLAIYDVMNLLPNDVSTLAMGFAASMGQFLLSAGSQGKRFSLPHARVLMHQGSAGLAGTTADIEIQAENLDYTNNLINDLIAEHTGQNKATVDADSSRDRWFTAQQALDYGFIDSIVAEVADVRPATASMSTRL